MARMRPTAARWRGMPLAGNCPGGAANAVHRKMRGQRTSPLGIIHGTPAHGDDRVTSNIQDFQPAGQSFRRPSVRAHARRTAMSALACLLAVVTFGANAAPVTIAAAIPYNEDADIQAKVRTECAELNTQFSTFIQQFAREKGVEMVVGDPSASTGRVLRVTITAAISQGNAWIGHTKSTSARGTLYEDGNAVASFRASRNSMGGMFAAYKGSCSVLGRTVRAMGEDIGTWLANPVDGAELGDR
jgi:hypothetical protein